MEATQAKNVKYPLWQVHVYLEFNEQSDRNGLWVCKYNRFLLFTKRMRMPPKLYFWDEATELVQHHHLHANNEVKYLASWINCFTSPRLKCRIGGDSTNECLRELMEKVKKKRHGKNDYFICVDVMSHNTSREALQDALEMAISNIANEGPGNFNIAITTETCIQCSVIKLTDFKMLLQTVSTQFYYINERMPLW